MALFLMGVAGGQWSAYFLGSAHAASPYTSTIMVRTPAEMIMLCDFSKTIVVLSGQIFCLPKPSQ